MGLWETDCVELDYHPSIWHIAFQVTLEELNQSVTWLTARGCPPEKVFGFDPVEQFVMAHNGMPYAQIHFDDPDDNSLELICPIENRGNVERRMYLSEWGEIS